MGTHAINVYDFVNRAGSSAGYACFTREIGVSYARQTLITATYDIWKWFEQYSAAQRKDVNRLVLILENFPDSQVQVPANATTNEIHLNGRYIASYSGDVKREITGVLYHEVTHVLQRNGNGQAPGWLIEGIADYARLRSCYIPSNWVKPGGGDSFYKGYDVTARFLDYCTGLRSNFVAELIKKLRPTGYVDDYFRQLIEKGVSDTRSGSNVEVVNVDCMNANDGNRQGYHANKEREIKKRGAMDYCV
ncbi:uncharacterized protein LOC112094817 [Morus notabilis]|uniref:uncharacterized protein LOC112094817 n=1 Tax=Morus notabilis TaxID=981085 RepID=UPI000CECE978|nr:uncharacterized protein LOC112094817 [Morus notabilis]